MESDSKPEHYSDNFHGYSVFVSDRNPYPAESLQFAELFGEALFAEGLTPSLHHTEPIPGEGKLLIDKRLGLYRFDNLVVLSSASMPAGPAGECHHRQPRGGKTCAPRRLQR